MSRLSKELKLDDKTKSGWLDVRVRIPVNVQIGTAGLTYVTSPFIRGLLVSDRTEAAALESVALAIEDLGRASTEGGA